MNFASDNVYGVDPRIMQAMVDANQRLTDVSYCHDDGAKQVEAKLSSIFETDVKAFLVVNGTGANSLALSAMCPPFGGVLCHESAHINTIQHKTYCTAAKALSKIYVYYSKGWC